MNSSNNDYKKLYQLQDNFCAKANLNELDVEQRLVTFPVKWLANVKWLNAPLDINLTQNYLHQIADDFFLGKNNSLGKDRTPLENASLYCPPLIK